MNNSKLVWNDAADERWAAEFESVANSESTTRPAEVDVWLAGVYDAVTDSGQRADDLFGSPESAVADFVESLPIERRAGVDVLGQTPTDVIGSVVCALGLTAVALAIVHGARDGWQLDVSRTTTGVALAVLFGSLGTASAWALRTTGRTAAAAWMGGVAAAGMIGSVAWATWSGNGASSLFTMSVWVPAAAGAVLFVAGWNWPSPAPTVDSRSQAWTATQWFARFEGLLRGRYHLPADVVTSHLREARELLDAEGSRRPFEEFGAPETYALALVEGDSRSMKSHGRARRRLWAGAAGALLAFTVADIAIGTYNLSTAVFSVAGACCAWQALSANGA